MVQFHPPPPQFQMSDDTTVILHRRFEIPDTDRTVFFVACYKHDPEGKKSRQRMWGWYSNFEDAEKAVLENHTDIFEHNYYDLAVIEEMREGVMGMALRVWWYKATYTEERGHDPLVEKIVPPAWTDGFFNFCMG